MIERILISVVLVFLMIVPYSFLEGPSICIHYKVLGFQCPGCGMTRALHNMLHLNLFQAIEMNFAVILVLPYLILLLIKPSQPGIKFDLMKKYIFRLAVLALGIVYMSRIIHHITV